MWNGKEFNTNQRRKAKETLPVSAYHQSVFLPSFHSPFPLSDQKEHLCVSNHSGFSFLCLFFSSVHFAGRHSYSDLSRPHLSGSCKDFFNLSLVTAFCNASFSNSLTVSSFLNLSVLVVFPFSVLCPDYTRQSRLEVLSLHLHPSISFFLIRLPTFTLLLLSLWVLLYFGLVFC